MTFSLPNFDLDAFVAATLAEDLGPDGRDVTSEAVIPADALFDGVMDSRDPVTVAGLPIAAAFFRVLEPGVEIELLVEDGAQVAAGTEPVVQSVTRPRPISTTTPHWHWDVSVVRPSTLSRLVKMIGEVAVPTALIRLPRFTASQDWPVPPNSSTPGSMLRTTLVSAALAVKPPSVPTSVRPASW